MAKAVSQAFKDHWTKKHGQKVVLSMQIQKRYQANPTSFVYTGVWEEMDQGLQVREFPRMTKALDYPFKNIFKTATITASVPNLHNEWIPTATAPSVFAADATAPDGYFAPLTKFRFRLGYILPDDTQEFTDQFTGFLLDIKPKGSSPYADLVIASSMYVFENLDIGNIVDGFVLEDGQPAVGDGNTKDFLTTSKGVKRLTAVQVDGVPVDQGDYEIDNIDDRDEAEVLIRTAPPVGQSIKQSGERWKQNIKIEDAVALIFDEAGIAPADRQISPALFPSVASSRTWDSQPEWEAGTTEDIDTVSDPGSIKPLYQIIDDWEDGDHTADPAWLKQGPGSSFVSGGTLTLDSTGANEVNLNLDRSSDSVGVWKFPIQQWTGNALIGVMVSTAGVTSIGIGSAGVPSGTGYALLRDGSNSAGFVRLNGGGSSTTLISGMTGIIGSTVLISRTSGSEWKIYFDSGGGPVLKGTVTNSTYTSGGFIHLAEWISAGITAVGQLQIGEINFINFGDYVWTSEVVDVGSVPIGWGNLDRFFSLSGTAAVTFETLSADDAAFLSPDPAGYLEVDPGGQINSALKQFLKVRITIQFDPIFDSAQVDKIIANFQVTSILLSVASFSGKDGITQLEQFARIVNYQLGAEDSGLAFFRSPSNVGSVITLTQENAIIDVLDWSPGWDRVKNVGSVRYGNYTAIYDKTNAGEAEPTSERRFDRKVASDNLSGLLLDNDAQLGESRAQVLYEDLVEPKRRLIIKAWFVPWLENDDVVTIDYFDHPIMKAFFWYDPLQVWGSSQWTADVAENILARSLDMRILEIDQDPVNPTTGGGITATYTLEEVLA